MCGGCGHNGAPESKTVPVGPRKVQEKTKHASWLFSIGLCYIGLLLHTASCSCILGRTLFKVILFESERSVTGAETLMGTDRQTKLAATNLHPQNYKGDIGLRAKGRKDLSCWNRSLSMIRML